MKRFLVAVIGLALGCGSSSSGTDPDAGPGDGDGGGSGSGDGDGGSSGDRTVKVTLTNRPNQAAMYSFMVAYQDGSAAWQLAPAPTGDTYSFTIHAPSYGVAFTCISSVPGMAGAQQRTVTAAHFAVGERTELTLDVPARCSDRAAGGVTLSGHLDNRPTNGVLVVQFGARSTFVGTQSGNFTMQVPAGTRDLIVTHAVPEGNGDYYIDEVLVERDLAVTANTQRALDFGNAEATSFFTVDASAAPANSRVVASTTLYTANGTNVSLVREAQNWETDSLATAQMRTTDLYEQSIAVSVLGQGATLTHHTSEPGEQTFVAPAPLGAVMTTVPTKQPYVTLETAWSAYPSVVGYQWNATQTRPCSGTNTTCTTVWSAFLSPGVTGAMPAYRMPDLSALTGWKDAFELASGQAVVGTVTAVTSSAGAGDFPTGIPAAGTDRVFVRTDYGLTP